MSGIGKDPLGGFDPHRGGRQTTEEGEESGQAARAVIWAGARL